MITLKFKTTTLRVEEDNAAKYRKIIDSGKIPKIKRPLDNKHSATRRDYPAFYPGMETAEYLSRYASLNNRLHLAPIDFVHADRAAPELDYTQPEAIEEALA